MGKRAITLKKRLDVYTKTNGHCAYCGETVEPIAGWEVEHTVPKKSGGSNCLGNLVPSCKSCNRLKRNRDIPDFKNRLTYENAEKLRRVAMEICRFELVDRRLYRLGCHIFFIADKLEEHEVSFFIDKLEEAVHE